ncbi:MAG: HAD family hydrolase [bacterium]
MPLEESKPKTKLRALLWDMGGPLIDEEPMVSQWFKAIQKAYASAAGRELEPKRLEEAMGIAVESFAPFAFRSALWNLCDGDTELYQRMKRAFRDFVGPYSDELRPGIRELLLELTDRIPMGIVANQGRGLEERLERIGIRHCFQTVNGSDDVHLWKPDTRLFERALQSLGAKADETAMIGDRQDNDITPAKMMGMTGILFRTGTHRNQPFRYPEEKPDWEVDSVEELRRLLLSLIE